MRTTAGSVGLVASTLGSLLCAFLFASTHLARPWTVDGRSMIPTLEPGDRLLVDLWTFRHRPPRAGELVLFRGPEPDCATIVKRAGATPPFPDDRPRPRFWPEGGRMQESGVWLRGDNLEQSVDSRHYGAVPRDRLLGRVVLRYWPPSRAGSVR